jgi:hypothetical protein
LAGGPLVHGSIKAISLAGNDPPGTVAVSGNLTVTGQSARPSHEEAPTAGRDAAGAISEVELV